MAKSPAAGRVKTRLAKDIGSAAATNFYRHTCSAVISRLSDNRSWSTVLNIAPDTGIHDRFWPQHLSKARQGRGDLGERMRRAMRHDREGPVVLIGTDIPEIRRGHIDDAFRVLRQHDFVFGPTPDGGFWLVGTSCQRYLLRAFRNVRWSTEFALQDTINSLKTEYPKTTVGFISELNDIDDGDDFTAVQSLYGRRVLPSRIC